MDDTYHLGNVRLSYSDTNKDGHIQPRKYFLSECDYIPFDPLNPLDFPDCIYSPKIGEVIEINNYYLFGLLHNYRAITGMQEGDAAYQLGGYSDFRADGSVEPNVEITNSTAENTGLTYLGFNGETSYMPANSNGSTGMLRLSNWFRDAISGAESSIAGLFRAKNEEFPQITYNGGMARTDFDASTHDKLRPGDKTFTLDWGSFVAPSTFPVEGSAGGRGYALSWATDRMADIFNLNKRGGKDTLFMKATFVGNGKDYLRDTMFAEPYRKNETTEQVLNRENKKFDSVKAKSKIFLTR